jgi:hypothetical protein
MLRAVINNLIQMRKKNNKIKIVKKKMRLKKRMKVQ